MNCFFLCLNLITGKRVKELLDLLGLTDKTIKVGVSLDNDLQYIIENGIDEYLKD